MTQHAAVGRPAAVRATGPRIHTLHPGDVALGLRGDRLETLLGSCVAIVLTDPRRTVGVMCHFVHAKPPPSVGRPSSAYAAAALDTLYGMLHAHAIAPRLCEAYVYGGGNMFPDLVQDSSVGDENVYWALDALAADGIPLIEHDLGGPVYRKLSWTVGPDAPRVIAVSV